MPKRRCPQALRASNGVRLNMKGRQRGWPQQAGEAGVCAVPLLMADSFDVARFIIKRALSWSIIYCNKAKKLYIRPKRIGRYSVCRFDSTASVFRFGMLFGAVLPLSVEHAGLSV